jgi:hypothetical protein
MGDAQIEGANWGLTPISQSALLCSRSRSKMVAVRNFRSEVALCRNSRLPRLLQVDL